jgi:1-acyl-sn-glycerol-3-phosphate acyltransferase
MDDWDYKPAADLGLRPTERLKSLRRESGLAGHASQSCWRMIVATYLRLYHRLKISGRENLPKEAPFVLVANHSSHLDALILAAAVPWRLRQSVFPIAAGDVFFETPAAAVFSAMMLNALPMWRRRCGSHAMQGLRDRLVGEPGIYILFPEGTRSRDRQIGRFKPGIGMIVAGTGVSVIPCHLAGAHGAFPPGARLPRPVAIQLQVGTPCTFEELPNERVAWQEIACRLQAAVASLGGGKVEA